MALIDDFKARFPEFSATSVDMYLPAISSLWQCYYPRGDYSHPCDREAILNLLAHMFVGEINADSSSARTISSQSVGSVSVGYEANSSSSSRLAESYLSTKYGQRFLMLINGRHGGVAV